jgi:asparagine synthase (glutamine-hydrolysing)
MCGIAGYFHFEAAPADHEALGRMGEQLIHRGPDGAGVYADEHIGFAFRRLAILDREHGGQPMCGATGVISICNGEIYNYAELRRELEASGVPFQGHCDVEVIPHLFERYGASFVSRLEGQFAIAAYDPARRMLILARDHFGVCPLYWAAIPGGIVFASEIRALLAHGAVPKALDPIGLDQVFCLPGVVSPRTLFRGISSVKPGNLIVANRGEISVKEYWDISYPVESEQPDGRPDGEYVEELRQCLLASTKRRLQSDVPVGIYLSGGLDSCLVGGMLSSIAPEQRFSSFSVTFGGTEMCEGSYQRRMAERLGTDHHEVSFSLRDVMRRLDKAVLHAETPLKETHDTASLALSEIAKAHGVSVALTGQGADELFAGYVGYRFDRFHREENTAMPSDPLERRLREQLWGDAGIMYDGNYASVHRLREELYSDSLKHLLADGCAFDTLDIRRDRLEGRHFVHQRSYLDLKLRLADHLLTDHGDRMAMANSVELRHPFLDVEVAALAERMPPDLKLNQFEEKFVVKRVADRFVQPEVVQREKFGWYSHGTPDMLQAGVECTRAHLDTSAIKRQGFFNPEAVERIRSRYAEDGFLLSQPYETDLLAIVLTLSIFLEQFSL